MKNWLDIIGWIGSMCFCLSAAPQAWLSIKQGNAEGVSSGMLTLWLIGEVFSLVYVWPKKHRPLIYNYIINLVFLLVIIFYKFAS